MSSYNHFGCSCCGGPFNSENCQGCSSVGSRNEFVYDASSSSLDNPPDFSYQPPQHQYETNSCEFCGNDAHYGYDCPPQVPEELAEYINSLSWNRPAYYYGDDDEDTIQYREYLENYPVAVILDFSIMNSLIMGNGELSTIPEKESDEFIKSSVEDLVPTPSEYEDLSEGLSEDLFDIESECDVPVCDDFMTSSNPLFDSDDDSTSSDDESFSDENVPKKIYSNPLFDEGIISIKIDPC
nr:hypothetical protein [Tanacetum cinerariifolium]